MIARRAFLAAGAAMLALPRCAHAAETRLSLSAVLEQGSLVVGKAPGATRVSIDGANVSLSPEGEFVFGFAYDRTKSAAIALRYADDTREVRVVAPVVRKYEVQSISGLPGRFVSPPPEELARIEHENELIMAVRTRDTDRLFFADGFDWPVPGIVSSLFGSRRILNGVPKAPHLGVDIAAPEGTPIRAAADGIVSFIGPDFYYDGNITFLDHGHGVSTSYMHQSKFLAKAGDKVARGQDIGLVGQTGRATGPHLHWGLNWFQLKLDPSLSTPAPLPPRA